MEWIAIALVLLGLYLAFKLVGFMLKLAMCVIVLAALYWLTATYLGLPLPT